VKAVPGVEAVSLAQWRPGSGWLRSGGIRLDGTTLRSDSGVRTEIYSNAVGSDFFHTLGIPVLEGRDITSADTPAGPAVVVVNQNFAERFLKDGALGHRIDDGAEIVGVVRNSKFKSVRDHGMSTIYYALSQMGMSGQITVEVRTALNPIALLPEIRSTIHELDPNLPLQNPITQAAQFENSYVTPMLFARLALGFGVLAVVLVATGLYGTLAYRLQRRRGEIGVRMALGALRGDVVRMILGESLRIAAFGLAVGLPLSLGVSYLLRSQLYQLSSFDSLSIAAALAITLLVSVGASLLPARQASRVNPMEAMRRE
jgi:predicted permease